MSDKYTMPPPVTKKSSKKELWEELQASRDEIESQQIMIRELKDQNKQQQNQINIIQSGFNQQGYQLEIIRKVLSATVALE